VTPAGDPGLVEVHAAASHGPANSQPEGIGRVAAVAGMACWNNLGRNVVFADRQLRPCAVWASTLYPDDDERSQFDLDVHAILDVPELDAVVVLNHLGLLRRFPRAGLRHTGPCRAVEPVSIASFAADVERVVAAGGVLVGSRPRSERAGGLLVSAPLPTSPADGRLDVDVAGERLGEVTALAVLGGTAEPLLAVGGPGQVVLTGAGGALSDRPVWRSAVDFRVSVLAWDGRLLWAAGPALSGPVDDYDWDALGAGGFAALEPADGSVAVAGPLPEDTAWGTGGVTVAPVGRRLAVAGRTGRVHLVDPADPGAPAPAGRPSTGSLGIAHAAVVGTRFLFGFNRGGYRLHALEAARTA
jgi:hypothetical protein